MKWFLPGTRRYAEASIARQGPAGRTKHLCSTGRCFKLALVKLPVTWANQHIHGGYCHVGEMSWSLATLKRVTHVLSRRLAQISSWVWKMLAYSPHTFSSLPLQDGPVESCSVLYLAAQYRLSMVGETWGFLGHLCVHV